MTEKTTHKLYGGKIEIDFYPKSHRYKKKGEKSYLISATAVTGILNKPFLIQWAVNLAGSYLKQYVEKGGKFTAEELYPIIDEAVQQHTIKKEEAATIGSKVHDYAEAFGLASVNATDLPEIPEEEEEAVINGITAFLDWVTNNKVNFIDCERMVYSKEHDYVGLTDAVAEVNGKKLLIDYKTGKGIYNEHYYQATGYRIAYEEETGEKLDGVIILHFNKENGELGVYELSDEDYQKNKPVFISLLTVKKREKELASNWKK